MSLTKKSWLLSAAIFFVLTQKIETRDSSRNMAAQSNAGEDYRLPISVIPKHYAIEVVPYITPNYFTFDGSVEILAEVVQNSSEIVLHIDDIEYKDVLLTMNNVPLKVDSLTTEETYHFLKIHVAEPVISGSIITIKITYTGNLNDEMRGFYRSSYVDSSGTTKYVHLSVSMIFDSV